MEPILTLWHRNRDHMIRKEFAKREGNEYTRNTEVQ